MSQILNLNKARKARDKARRKAQANENAVKFGRNKADKSRDEAAVRRQRDTLDGHRLDE